MSKKTISIESKICRNEELVTSEIDGEVVMMSIDNGEYYGMDAIGSRIWELIDKPTQVDQLIETLMAEFQVDRETCKHDVLVFLNDMSGSDVIKICP